MKAQDLLTLVRAMRGDEKALQRVFKEWPDKDDLEFPHGKEQQLSGFQRIASGARATLFEGELPYNVSPVWQIIISSTSIPNAANANACESAIGRLAFGTGRSGVMNVEFDLLRGTTISVPAGNIKLEVDCTVAPSDLVPDLPSGEFGAICVPGSSFKDSTLIRTITTGEVAVSGTSGPFSIPNFSWAVRCQPSPLTGLGNGFEQGRHILFMNTNPAVGNDDARCIIASSGTTIPRHASYDFLIPKRAQVCRVFNNDATNAYRYNLEFRIAL